MTRRKGPILRFLDRPPILRRRRRRNSPTTDTQDTTIPPRLDTPFVPPQTIEPEPRPSSGRTSIVQTDEGYCLECISGHTMSAKTELRHALDRFRTAGKMTPGVVEKVRTALEELQGIKEDVSNTQNAPDNVKRELNEILDEVRWIRKDYDIGGKALTLGLGGEKDLIELRDRVVKIQDKAYDIADDCPTCSQAVGINWSLGIAEALGMSNSEIERIRQEVIDGRSPAEAMDEIIAYAEGVEDSSVDVLNLKDLKRMMFMPLSELDGEIEEQ